MAITPIEKSTVALLPASNAPNIDAKQTGTGEYIQPIFVRQVAIWISWISFRKRQPAFTRLARHKYYAYRINASHHKPLQAQYHHAINFIHQAIYDEMRRVNILHI